MTQRYTVTNAASAVHDRRPHFSIVDKAGAVIVNVYGPREESAKSFTIAMTIAKALNEAKE